MSPKPIGVVGGAGPFAGLCLLDRLFSIAQSRYGCANDKDFPLVILYSFPFSDMLSVTRDEKIIRNELSASLDRLRSSGAELLAIACNTLHAFTDAQAKLIALPEVTAKTLKEVPLVLCTSTSRTKQLHRQAFNCIYPDDEVQIEVDEIIRRTLAGENCLSDLQKLIAKLGDKPLLLGCTELSLYSKWLKGLPIIDPLELLAIELLKESFK